MKVTKSNKSEICYFKDIELQEIIDHKTNFAKITKTSLHMLPKLDEQGDPMVLKTGKRPNGKVIKESRTTLETFLEYYVEDREDTETIIKMFAMNAETFNYAAVLDSSLEEVPQAPPSKIIL